MKLFHGTDEQSASSLLRGEQLDSAKAIALKIDGPSGFFLAFALSDAEFFALRRGRAVVIQYELSAAAMTTLEAAGAIRQPIPIGARSPKFSDDELFIPITSFEAFNELLRSGEIKVSAAP
jgi:hypothetical protein